MQWLIIRNPTERWKSRAMAAIAFTRRRGIVEINYALGL